MATNAMSFEVSAEANPSKIPEYIVASVMKKQNTKIATANHTAHCLGRSKKRLALKMSGTPTQNEMK
jgi:hypothetical protein